MRVPSSRHGSSLGPMVLGVCIVSLLGCNNIFGFEEGKPLLDDSAGGAGAVGATGGSAASGAVGATGTGAGGLGGSGATGGLGGTGGTGGTGAAGGTGGSGGSGGTGAAGGTGGSGGSLPTCTQQYGTLPDFALCDETATSCDVETDATGTSCSAACRLGGGRCTVGDWSNGSCSYGGVGLNCGIGDMLMICTCTRGCNGSPACVDPEVCEMSGCVNPG